MHMKKNFMLLGMFLLPQFWLWAQQTVITGKVRASGTPEAIAAASIMLKNSTLGTFTDAGGRFSLRVPSLPATLTVSAVGFGTQELTVNDKEPLTINMTVSNFVEQPVVVSPTRVPIRLMESPVSIERLGPAQLRASPTTNYYDLAAYSKGIDVTTSSFTFKTISTRGFNGSGSYRVNQQVDGMDNQAPGLNFPIGNFAGVVEGDVESIEVLPGASSALYGPGGINGTVLITSKNPFKYQGLSVVVKEGVSNIDKSQRSDITPFHDFSLRYAKAINRFAFKVGAQYTRATDWLASDSSNYTRLGDVGKVIPGTRATDPNYDGVNVYGDETSLNLRRVATGGQYMDLWSYIGNAMKQQAPPLARGIDAVLALSPATLNVSRTGYHERDVIDPATKNIKLSGSLNYKLTSNIEGQLAGYWSTGNTVYTGNNRYVLKDIKIAQYKAEIRHPRWFVRSYTTQEDAGESYSATIAAQYFNEAWKPSSLWYQQYTQAFLSAAATRWTEINATQGADAANAAIQSAFSGFHAYSRAYADTERPEAGSAQFHRLYDSVRMIPISQKGGRFLETSQMWMTEGQYNLSNLVRVADVVVGGNWKHYILNSEGTLFIDTAGSPIRINELGAYVQVSKSLVDNYLTLSFSGRYDKNEDFKGRFTPRATALVKLAPDNNLRLSYQTAYRFPGTQQKYIRLNVGSYTILGGLPWVMDYMKAPLFEVQGTNTKPYTYKELKPESMESFEVGYKGLVAQKLQIDAYGYFGTYRDFLGRNILVEGTTGRIFSTVVNSTTEVKTHGFGLGLDYQLPSNFSAFFNGYSDVLADVPLGFLSYFNTPKYRFNAGIGNTGLGKAKALGFNALLHWQDAFDYEGELANGHVNAFTTVDAQVSYRFPRLHTMVKLGGTNIFNHYYKNAYGNPEIGGLYYVSLSYGL